MTNRNGTLFGALGLAMLVGVGALAGNFGHKQPADNGAQPAAPGNVAVVDMDYLYVASGAREFVMQKTLVEIRNEATQRLTLVGSAPYLTPQERDAYIDLVGKNQLTDMEQARIKALKATSDQRFDELQKLQVKKEADTIPADKARVRELVEMRRALEQVMPGIEEVIRLRQNQQSEAVRRDQVTKLRAAVAQVAKEKGCTQVFDNNALVYSSNDLTPLVLQYLTKHPGK